MEAVSSTQVKRKMSIDGGPNAAEVSKILRLSYKRRKVFDSPDGYNGQGSLPTDSLLHLAPPDIVPILQPPMQPFQFFSDIKSMDTDPQMERQIRSIIHKFPPPIPPFLPPNVQSSEGGIMVPFIYPPPPIIEPEKLPYSIASFAKKSISMGRSGAVSPLSDKVYTEIPPLPFPPPNYMPYPLLSDKSSLTPGDVFEDLLDASEQLPRIDMVVASAAGSLFEIKTQAEDEGFSIEDFESNKSYRRILRSKRSISRRGAEDAVDGEELSISSDDESKADKELNDYLEYASQIKTDDTFDKYQISAKEQANEIELDTVPENYTYVAPNSSNIRDGEKKAKKVRKNRYDSSLKDLNVKTLDHLPVSPYDIFADYSKEVTLANGSNRESRREELLTSVDKLESYHNKNRRIAYESQRSQLLEKIKNLKDSKLLFEDSEIYDKELQDHEEYIGRNRDEDLLKLRFVHNYELLKSSFNFYKSSNKIYKNMNSLVLNKLQKLKNFFEFQKDLFHGYLDNENHDIFDVNTKESNHLFNGVSERDYGTELKEIINNSVIENDAEKMTSFISKVNSTPSSIHDFMPLISLEEFSLITGDLPNKMKSSNSKDSGKNKHTSNIKHRIFQSHLYNPATSGSETNTSDSTSQSTHSKRRGRRGGTSASAITDKLVDDSDKSRDSETVLLAKIMKHFSGPQAANTDELTKDLDLMGIKSRWPPQVSK